jgi:hypothetical protein
LSYHSFDFVLFPVYIWIYKLLIVISVMQLILESIVYITFLGGGGEL